jgi:anti-anti-sigma factor
VGWSYPAAAPLPDHISAGLRGGEAQGDGRPVYRLEGEIDMSAAEALLVRTGELAAAHEGDVVLDLEKVTFIDSAGMRALLIARENLTAAGRALRLVNVTPEVRRLLDLVGLTGVLSGDEPPA